MCMANIRTANHAAISFSVCMYFSMKNVKICSLGYFNYVKSFKTLTALFEMFAVPKCYFDFHLKTADPTLRTTGIEQKVEFGRAGVACYLSQ